MNRKKLFSLLMAFVLVLSVSLSPASTAEESFSAGTMRLLQFLGDVQILDLSGVPRFVMENVRFASGETMVTGAESKASVGMDDTKIVTMDADTRVEFIQEGEHMKLNLLQGGVFVDVSEKLDENASFDIQTTTLTVGIRGTLIFARILPNGQIAFGIAEGGGRFDYLDAGGTHQVMDFLAGDVVIADPVGTDGGVSLSVSQLNAANVPQFVKDTVLADDTLKNRFIQGSPQGESALQPSVGGDGVPDSNPDEPYPADGDWSWTGTVQLVAQSASKLYDGTVLSRPSNVIVRGLPLGCSVKVSSKGSITNVGTADNVIDEYHIFNSSGQEITGHFKSIKPVKGVLRVDPAPLTVWTGSAEKVYDGEPLTCGDAEIRTVPGYEYGEPEWRNSALVTRSTLGTESMISVSGNTWVHGINPVTGELEELMLSAGQRLTVSLNTDGGSDSFSFVVEDVKVEDLPDSVVRLYAANPDLLAQALEDNKSWTAAAMKKRIAALGKQKTDTDESHGLNVPAANVSDLVTDSANVRITIDTEITDYGSRALNGEEANFVPVELDPTIKITVTGTQTEIGKSENTCEIDWGDADPDNYTVRYDLGELVVLSEPVASVTLKASSATKAYDGKALTSSRVNATGLPEGFTFKATASGSQTKPGTAYNTVRSWQIFDAEGTDVSSSCSVTLAKGTLTVTKADLVVSTKEKSRAYNGKPLKAGDPVVSGLAAGESITVTVKEGTGEITAVGSVTPVFEISWGSADKNNYNLTEQPGKLAVTKAPLTVSTKEKSRAYNGKPLKAGDPVVEGLASGESISVSLKEGTGEITDVGSVTPEFVFDWGSTDKGNYKVSKNPGTLTVTKNSTPITITLKSLSKVYDGRPLDGTLADSSVKGLPSGFFAYANGSSSLTDAGTVQNKVSSYMIGSSSTEEDVTKNFSNVTVVPGKLTVKPAPLTVQTPSDSKVYDGYPLPETTDQPTLSGLIGDETAEISCPSGQLTEAGTKPNAYKITWGTAKKGNYTITESLGTLTVKKLGISIETEYEGAFGNYTNGDHNGESIEFRQVGYSESGDTEIYKYTARLFTGDTLNLTVKITYGDDSVTFRHSWSFSGHGSCYSVDCPDWSAE